MNVVICCIGDPAYDVRVAARQLDYNSGTSNFSMPCPMGDDWLQKVNYLPSPAPSLVRFADTVAFVVFEFAADASKFCDWLRQANVSVEQGFATMRG